jgi:UDP-2,3-diacylglucosamine hydrolase
MPAAVPPIAELHAPPAWRVLDFISDQHLHASEPATFEAWRHHLLTTPADAVFMLGDLFEVWVGDDVLQDGAAASHGFEQACAQVLREAAAERSLFFMRGNRDFLVGQGFAQACQLTLLDDPTVLQFGGARWLLTHGDALCWDDADYMAFRAQVRSPAWQQQFLAKPLLERAAIAAGLRAQSEARKHAGVVYGDLDAGGVRDWLQAADAATMVHGHTHRPADHAVDGGRRRLVLSDWHLEAAPPRAGVLRLALQADGSASVARVPPA